MGGGGYVASMGAMGLVREGKKLLGNPGSVILKLCVKNTVCEGKN